MRPVALAASALLCTCSAPEELPLLRADIEAKTVEVEVETEEPIEDASVDEESNPPEVITVPASIAISNIARVAPHQSESYAQRCREESRGTTGRAERVEDRNEARQQARLTARDGAISTTLLFARIAYGETGAPDPVEGENDDPTTHLWDEAASILAVIDNLRRGRSRAEMMATYAPRRIFPRPDDVRQQWLAEVQLDGRMPASWHSSRGLWRAWACPRWLATVDAVESILEAHPDDIGQGPCQEVPDHWGGEMDTRAIELGWRRVICAGGHTRNLFWAVPSRAERREETAANTGGSETDLTTRVSSS